MRRSHYIFADETGIPRPPVYLTAYPLRRRTRVPWPTVVGVVLLVLAVLAMIR
jgi:hypothetical protein